MPTAGSLDLPSFRATVDHRAGAGGSARQRGDQRHHARASRETGPARRDVSTGADCAPRGVDRPRPPVPHRPAACSCERRCAGEQAAPAPAAACGAVGRGRSGAAGAGAGGPRASPGAAGGVGRGRCVHARWRSAEHWAGGSVCVGGAHSSRAAGRPFASVRARAAPRPAHGGALTAGRHAGRGGLLTSSRCRAGAASAVHEHAWDGVCTCGATRLRIEWSEERWDVVSRVRTLRTGTCRSMVSTASAPPRPAQPQAPNAAPRLFSTPPPSTPRAPPAPPRVTSAPSPPLSPLLRHRHRLHDRRCLLPTATFAPSTLAAAALAPRLQHHTLLASPPPHPTRSRRRGPCPRCSHHTT